MSDVHLEDLFHECDRNGQGKIGPEEFQELCAKFDIGSSDSDVIFSDLDRDGDGQICLEDFACGFRDFLSPDKQDKPGNAVSTGGEHERRNSQAWATFVASIGEPALQNLFHTSGKKLADLYMEIQNCSPSSELITHFEGALGSLMKDVKRLHEDNEKLEEMFNRERQTHMLRLRGLEEEIDAQVAKVEAQARDEAREKFEFEKKELMKKMEAETIELKTHLKLFQKVNTVLSQKKVDKSDMDETIEESRELRRKLIDTQMNLAVVRSEMENLRSDYEIKCEEFNNKVQINVDPLEDQSGAQYTIKRLMDDIDSGRSTLMESNYYQRDLQDELSSASSINAPYHSAKTIEFEEMSLSGRESHNLMHYHQPTRAMSICSYDLNGSDPERTYKIVFAGDAAVGKTCFIHRFCKGVFATKLGSTLGVDFQMKTIRVDDRNVALQLWDTAGQERFRSITKAYFRRADGVVLLYDVTNERSFINIRQWILSITDVSDKQLPVCICGNKVDLRREAELQGLSCVSTNHGELLAQEYDALFFETSSKIGTNINNALVTLSREMLIREDVDIQTSALYIAEQPPQKFNSNCC